MALFLYKALTLYKRCLFDKLLQLADNRMRTYGHSALTDSAMFLYMLSADCQRLLKICCYTLIIFREN